SLIQATRVDREEALTHERLFRRETQTWLDLGAHPNVVTGFYTMEVDGVLRFFMEYVPGKSLEHVASMRLRLPHAIDLALQIASAMAWVHKLGVVHRDLKPSNCIVMRDGTVRVTDFGLARVAGASSIARLVATTASELDRTARGTPMYMAPEQWE